MPGVTPRLCTAVSSVVVYRLVRMASSEKYSPLRPPNGVRCRLPPPVQKRGNLQYSASSAISSPRRVRRSLFHMQAATTEQGYRQTSRVSPYSSGKVFAPTLAVPSPSLKAGFATEETSGVPNISEIWLASSSTVIWSRYLSQVSVSSKETSFIETKVRPLFCPCVISLTEGESSGLV